MLSSMRRLSKSKVGSFILILFVLAIAASFALSDVQNVVSGGFGGNNATLATVGSKKVTDQEMARFPYVEHKQNVALALAVARELGVPRDVAMRGMLAATPDVGALREFELDFFGRRIVVVNGFAANDPVSTEQIWNLTLERHPGVERRIMVVNCRFDRPDRSRQLGEAIPRWHPADRYVLIGSGTYVFARTAVAAGLSAGLLLPLEGIGRAAVFEEIVGICGRSSLVMGVGNIGGIGLELLRHFRNRARPDGHEIEGAAE